MKKLGVKSLVQIKKNTSRYNKKPFQDYNETIDSNTVIKNPSLNKKHMQQSPEFKVDTMNPNSGDMNYQPYQSFSPYSPYQSSMGNPNTPPKTNPSLNNSLINDLKNKK